MFSKVAIVSVVVGAVAAQSISGASEGCNAYLKELNSNSALTACTKSLLTAGASFNATSASADSATQSLTAFCSASTSCSEDSIRSALSTFYSKCNAELAGGANKEVTLIYDTIYALTPYKAALCSKGDDGKLCAISGPSSTTIPLAAGGSMPAQEVVKSMGSNAPNGDVFAKTNMLFMFLNPSTATDVLCTSCTRNILTAYLDFEGRNDYGPGFGGSILLSGQKALWKAVDSQCPAGFLAGSLQAAGGLSDGLASSSGASPKAVASGATILAVLFSAIAVAAY